MIRLTVRRLRAMGGLRPFYVVYRAQHGFEDVQPALQVLRGLVGGELGVVEANGALLAADLPGEVVVAGPVRVVDPGERPVFGFLVA